MPAPISEPPAVSEAEPTEPEPPLPEPESVAELAEPTEPTERVEPTEPTHPTGTAAARTGPSTGPRRDTVAKQPTLTRNVIPVYPKEAKQAGLAGTVVVELQLSDQGTVVSVRVISSTDAVFEVPAVDAAKKLLFRPARDKAGQPIAAAVRFTFRFQVN